MVMSMDPQAILKELRSSWQRPTGLVLLIALFAGGAKFLVPDDAPWQVGLGIPVIVGMGAVLIWSLARRPRKAKKNKVGICIALACESDEDRKKVKADFIDTLRELAAHGGAAGTLDVFEFPEHLCSRIEDPDAAQVARLRVRAHMMIYGRIRRREVDGKGEFFISLNGIVAHRPVPKEVQRRFSEEFGEVLPTRIRLGIENDVLSFDVLSTWTDIAARYVVGIAALISGDADYAEVLFRDLEKRLSGARLDSLPALEKIRRRLPSRLRETADVRADRLYRLWVKFRNPEYLTKSSAILNLAPAPDPNSGAFFNLRAIEHVVLRGDAETALKVLDEYKGPPDAGILVNRAFVLALLGRPSEATSLYRKLADFPPGPALSDVQEQVDTFLSWYLSAHPDVASVQFLRGYFLRKIKKESEGARELLMKFSQNPDASRFPDEMSLAVKWLGQDRESESAAGRSGPA